MKNVEVIEYETSGTCCQLMKIAVDSDGIIKDSEFYGGCNGNLQGIKSLIQGMHINDVIEKFKGISCNGKPTSCPDQLATCLIAYKKQHTSV